MSAESPARRSELSTSTSQMVTPPLSAGSLLAGRYRIEELVGVGGMGMVYRAMDERLGLTIAVKALRPETALGSQGLERFQQELVLARRVSHPNVVRIHDIGNDGAVVFLTMDFMPGRSLRGLLNEERRLDPERAAGIARRLALALEAAHRAGVVHRDLKPENVLVDEDGGSLQAAITDFGVARSLAGSRLTLPGIVIGTISYLSPEQAGGGEVDGRSDLYALGLLLYEMLTGDLPFATVTNSSDAERLAQRLMGASLRWGKEPVPPGLRAVVRKLLARDPARRYQNAGEVVADLDRSAQIPVPPKRRWLAPATTTIAAAGLALLLALGWVLRDRLALLAGGRPGSAAARPAPAPRRAVALLPLADETGRPDLAWVAPGMPEMLAEALAESPELRVLDSQRVSRTLFDLKLPRGPLPEVEARRLATLLDADRLVAGRVRAAGGRLRIDVSLFATDPPGLPAATLHAEAAEGEAFRLVEQLGEILRRQLAVSPAVAAPVTSRSPQALADFSTGAASLGRGDALAAVPALERAVAADPRYSAAWVQLARARQALGRDEPARDAARHAVETAGPGESRAAYEARAVEARLLGRPDRAQEILGKLLARYPGDVEAGLELAEAYGEQGSLDRALAALQETVRRVPHHPRAWFLLGKYSILAGDPRRAVDEYLVRALVVQNELGSEQGRAELLNAFGVAYRNLGEIARATESYEQAAALRKKIGDVRGYATTLRNLASLHILRGEYAAAESQLTAALALLEKLGDAPGIADLYNDFGALAEQRGHFAEALERYRQALRVRRDLGNDLALAQSFSNVGFACYLLGHYDDASVYWRQGLDLAQKSGDPDGVVLATQNLGQLQLAQGDWNEAVKSFLTALSASRELGMKEATAVSLGNLGRLAQYQGRPAAALASYAEALAVLHDLGDRRGLAEFTLAAAEAELELGMTDAAADRLRAAAELLREGTNQEQEAELDRLRAELYLARGEPGDAAAAATALRRAAAAATASHGVVEILAVRLSAADLPGAGSLDRLERLRAEADALGHARLRLRAAEAVARAALAVGDLERAQRAARAGLEQVSAHGGYAGAYRLHGLLALALEAGGARLDAAAESRRAAEEIARLGRDLSPGQHKFFDRLVEVQDGTYRTGARLGKLRPNG